MRTFAVAVLALLTACGGNSDAPQDTALVVLPTDTGVVAVQDGESQPIPPAPRGFAQLHRSASACVTRADTLDERYVRLKIDTLETARGVGEARRIATAARGRVAGWLTRVSTRDCGGVMRVDTIRVTVRDTVRIVRVDTVYVNAPPPPPVNQRPVAGLDVTCDNATRRCTARSTSTDDKGITAYAWTWGDGATSTATGTATRTYAAAGTYTVGLTVRDAEGLTASASRQVTIGVTLPDTTKPDPVIVLEPVSGAVAPGIPVSVSLPAFTASTRTLRVAATGNLQAALDTARSGDVILLPRGAGYTGNFLLPTKPCGAGWITVRTDIADSLLPPEGTRIVPDTARRLARIVTPSGAPAIKTQNPTCRWRFLGVELTAAPSFTGINYGVIWLGDGGWAEGGETQNTLDRVPRDIVLDRVIVRGQPNTNTARCIALNSANTVIRDSWIAECHGRGFDSQAIVGWNGPGPYLIENNYLEGAGENVMFGGADPGVPGLIPSDITLRRNHFYKNPSWRSVWTVKNLFELKSAQRVLLEGNVFENVWADAQAGMAIVIKSQTGNEAGRLLHQGSTDVLFRYNVVRCANRAFNLQAAGEGGSNRPVARVRAEHNFFDQIGVCNGVTGADGWLNLLVGGLSDVVIRRNTYRGNLPGGGLSFMLSAPAGSMRNLRVPENAFGQQGYYHVGVDGAACCTAGLTHVAGSSWSLTGNAFTHVESQFHAPSGNTFLGTLAQLGVTANGGTAVAGVGADAATLAARTRGVVVDAARLAADARRPRAVPVLRAATRADVPLIQRLPKGSADIPVGQPRRPPRR